MAMAQRDTFELGTDGPRTIVTGVDGTPASLRAVAYAAGLARRQHAQLVCVYVRRPPSGSACLSCLVDPAILAAEETTVAEIEAEVRQRIVEDSATWGIGVRLVVRSGDVLAEIARVARDVGADTIVVGASRGIVHRLFGSLGSRLQRRGRWPVTVVP
ncbi:MAG TPA: universal stress protein [Streptosporangiaceae bacterium]